MGGIKRIWVFFSSSVVRLFFLWGVVFFAGWSFSFKVLKVSRGGSRILVAPGEGESFRDRERFCIFFKQRLLSCGEVIYIFKSGRAILLLDKAIGGGGSISSAWELRRAGQQQKLEDGEEEGEVREGEQEVEVEVGDFSTLRVGVQGGYVGQLGFYIEEAFSSRWAYGFKVGYIDYRLRGMRLEGGEALWQVRWFSSLSEGWTVASGVGVLVFEQSSSLGSGRYGAFFVQLLEGGKRWVWGESFFLSLFSEVRFLVRSSWGEDFSGFIFSGGIRVGFIL